MIELDESDLDLDESDDDLEEVLQSLGEAKKRRRFTPQRVNPGRGKNLYQPPSPSGAPVTEARLKAALAEVTKNFEVTAAAVRKIDARVGQIESVNSAQTKAIKVVKRDSDKSRDLLLLQTLMNPGSDQLSRLLPLMMLTGNGSESGSGGFGGLGDNPMMLILMMEMFKQPAVP